MIPKLSAMALLPVKTYYLSPAEFGTLGTLASIASFLTPMILLGTTAAVVRAYYDKKEGGDDYKSYVISTWLGVSFISIVLVAAIVFIGAHSWEKTPLGNKFPFHPHMSLTIVKVFLAVIGTSLLLPVFRAMQRPWLYVIFMLGAWFLNLIFGLYGLVKYGLVGQIVAELPSCIIISVASVAVMIRMFGTLDIHLKHFKAALAFGLPLVPHMLAIWVMNMSDRVLLASMVPMADVGLYNLAMSIAIVMVFVITSINMAWTPRYYEIMAEKDRNLFEVRKYGIWWLIGIGFCCLVMMLFARDAIDLLATKNFAGSSRFVPMMAFSFFAMGIYLFGVNPLFYHKRTKLIPWVSGGAALLNILLNLLLIPRLGAIGAVVSTLSAQVSMATIFHCVTRKTDPMPYPYLEGLLPVLGLGALAIWLSFLQYPSELSFFVRVGIAVILLPVFIPLLVRGIKEREA